MFQQREQQRQQQQPQQLPQGAIELKICLQNFNTIREEIRAEFETELQNPCARVAFNKPSVGTFEFNATMCRVSHNDFIHNMRLHGEFTAHETALASYCEQTELIRKMLVSNKQHKNTHTKQLQRTIRAVRAALRSALRSALRTDCCIESEQDPDCIIQLKRQKEKVKQHHKTVSRNLLNQVRLIIVSCWRHIHAQKIAAQDTIRAIIQHAEKCRAFIAKCQHFASIEKSTAKWWFEAHPEHAKDHRVSVSPGETFNPRNLAFNASDPLQFSATLPIQIIVHDPQYKPVFNCAMDQTLADMLL